MRGRASRADKNGSGDARALVLVVDDEPDTRALVATLLKQVGYDVAQAFSGEEALDVAAQRAPDMVVLDVVLPGMDGFETCRRLKRQQGLSLPVLMLSGRGRKAVIQGLEAGADDYLPKPFDVDEFWARVEALLRIRAAEAAALRRAERLLSLQRLSAAVAAQQDEAMVLQLVLVEAQRLLEATGVVYYQWDPAAGLLSPLHVIDPPGSRPPTVRRPGQGLVSQALARREPIYVNDYASWEHATAESREAGVAAAVAAPVLQADETIGVITARKLAAGARFDDEDAQLLGLLAGQAAAALSNARMHAAERAAAARAAERAAQLEAVMESMADGVVMVDASGSITSANRAAGELLNVARELLIGAPVARALPPVSTVDGEPLVADQMPLPAVLRSGVASVDLELLCDVGGRERIFLVTTTPVRDGGDEVVGAVSVFRDVTERRRADERAAQADKLRALGQMASGVAHDVNNLLASVMGRAELARLELERGGLDENRLAEALSLIEQAADDGAQTVRRIQEFARVRRDTDVTIVDLGEIVQSAVGLTRPRWRDAAQAEGRTVDLEIRMAAELYVAAEPAELREVMTNLILNAVDAMPRGGTITIAGTLADDGVQLEVRDSGVGMTPAVKSRVFEPFFTTKAEAGNGLGLAVSYGIIQRRGGQISVESAPGSGSVFRIELPIAERRPQPVALATRRSPRARHILVVDDEPALASVLQRLLESEGHRVTTCTSGAEALAVFNPDQHELVMTDLGMAGLNGLQVAAAIHLRSASTPVILVTGWGNELDPDNPPRGIARVLAKPYRLARVLDAVNEALPEPAAVPARS